MEDMFLVMLCCCCAKSYFISQQKLEHRLGYVNSFHVLSQMAVSFVGSLEQQQNVESRLAFEDLGLELYISWPIEILFHAFLIAASSSIFTNYIFVS